MKRISFATLFVLGAIAACSGYEGGGDVLVRGGTLTSEGGTAPNDASTSADADASTPRDASTDGSTDAQNPSSSTVVAYWSFDGHGLDQSPANAGLNLDIKNPTFDTGRVGTSIVLSSEGIAAARPQYDAAFTFGTGDFTIQAWVSSSPGSLLALGTQQFGVVTTGGWSITVSPTMITFESGDTGGLGATVTSSSAFRHVAVRRRTGTVAIFADGVNVKERADWPAIVPGRVFSVQRPSGTLTTPPRVDEVAIWSRALDDSEIAANRTRGLGGQPPNMP